MSDAGRPKSRESQTSTSFLDVRPTRKAGMHVLCSLVRCVSRFVEQEPRFLVWKGRMQKYLLTACMLNNSP